MADRGILRSAHPRPHLHRPADGHWVTFGSIAALYGLTNGLISQQQYSVLVTVVILSAFVPTLIAQKWFEPELEDTELEDTVGEEDLTQLHRHHHPEPQPE